MPGRENFGEKHPPYRGNAPLFSNYDVLRKPCVLLLLSFSAPVTGAELCYTPSAFLASFRGHADPDLGSLTVVLP